MSHSLSASNSKSNVQHEVPLPSAIGLEEPQTCRPVFNLKPLMRGPMGEVPEGLLSRNECIELLPRQAVHDDDDDDDSTQSRSAVQRCCEGDPALQAVQKEKNTTTRVQRWQQPKSLEKWNRNSVTQRGCKISFIVAFFTGSIRTPVVTLGNRVRHMHASPKAPQVTA